jgi:antitoxin MazE
MTTNTIFKSGNSLAVRLPRHIAESAKLSEGQCVELTVEDEALVVRPSRKKLKLADLLAGYERRDEVDWGGPVGDEAW